MDNKFTRFLSWVAASVFLLCALPFFPSFSSLVFLTGAVLVAPIPQVWDFLKRRGLNFVAHILLAGAIFFGGIMSAPTSAPELPESEEPPSVTRSLPASAEADAEEEPKTALQVEPEPDAEEETRLAAEEQARQEEEARRAAEEQARQEEEARRAAEEQARQEEEARLAAEEQARQEEEARLAAEEQARQEEEARLAAEEQARREEEARRAAEEQARQEEEARKAAEEQARREEEARKAAEAASRQMQIPKSSPASNFDTYDNAEQQKTGDTYVLNTSSKKIHEPTCRTVPKIAPQNYATSSKSISELESDGYTRCGVCNPD